jgi:hypothetical protein
VREKKSSTFKSIIKLTEALTETLDFQLDKIASGGSSWIERLARFERGFVARASNSNRDQITGD